MQVPPSAPNAPPAQEAAFEFAEPEKDDEMPPSRTEWDHGVPNGSTYAEGATVVFQLGTVDDVQGGEARRRRVVARNL